MRLVSRRKVVTTDVSNTGLGALCDGRPEIATWSGSERRWHINCLEMMVVHLMLKAFLPDLKGHHVLVRTDNM